VHEDYWGNPRPLNAPEIGADEWMLIRPVLTPDYSSSSIRNVMTFTHVLTNYGNYTDTYNLAAISDLHWSLVITPPVTVTLGFHGPRLFPSPSMCRSRPLYDRRAGARAGDFAE